MASPEKTARPDPEASAPGASNAPAGSPGLPLPPELARPPELAPLAAFVGTWRGEGRGTYPTIADFAYGEEIRLLSGGRPFLVYEQRTWALGDERPLHAEAGYWRPKPGGRIELLIAQATGMVEVDEGTIDDGRVRVASRAVASAATGPVVTSVERELLVAGDEMRYELRMAAVGQPLLIHLVATLRRVVDA
jgi:hypothetical protein